MASSSSTPLHASSFQCPVPGCNARYRRREHLTRHEASHSDQPSFTCSTCGRQFGRSDTLRRHVRQRHKIIQPTTRAHRACKSCHLAKTRCEGDVPCDECLRRKIHCSLNVESSVHPAPAPAHATPRAGRGSDSESASESRLSSSSSLSEQTEQCIALYFETFHAYWPFVHRGSFDVRHETPLLVQSMVVIGLWASGEQPAQWAAVELHDRLDLAIREQKEKWDASVVESACSGCIWPLPTYQAILLHTIFSFILQSHKSPNFDLNIAPPSTDLELLESLVQSCRRLGMFSYPNITARYTEFDLDSFVWAGVEEIKRFNIALYKVCAKVSSPNDSNSLLAASELQFPLPDNWPLWNAAGRREWMALVKDARMVDLQDDRRADWISNFAGVLDALL